MWGCASALFGVFRVWVGPGSARQAVMLGTVFDEDCCNHKWVVRGERSVSFRSSRVSGHSTMSW